MMSLHMCCFLLLYVHILMLISTSILVEQPHITHLGYMDAVACDFAEEDMPDECLCTKPPSTGCHVCCTVTTDGVSINCESLCAQNGTKTDNNMTTTFAKSLWKVYERRHSGAPRGKITLPLTIVDSGGEEITEEEVTTRTPLPPPKTIPSSCLSDDATYKKLEETYERDKRLVSQQNENLIKGLQNESRNNNVSID